jgi:hypothetical protein
MSKKPVTQKADAEKAVKDIRRATRKVHSAEEKIRIVLAGLRGEDSIAELAAGRGSPKACTTAGRRNFSKLARNGWQATWHAKRPARRSRICVPRRSPSRRLWPS